MLIPSIDLQAGRIVQLVQGEALAVESTDIEGWIGRFSGFPAIQLIDLDAAKGAGTNRELIEHICGLLPCRVGGGIRTMARAAEVLEGGATRVIVGSALFRGGSVDLEFAAALRDAVGADRVIAAVDSRGGRIVVNGWRTQLPITPFEAIRALEPFVTEFLYTHVDREGLMMGTDFDAVRSIRAATEKGVTAAGGISTLEEVEALHALGVDAVVGMALYTGRIRTAAE
jgi:phosphoribosylformimino-5-aminoimidazole carboxamide ribotide isomerase